MIALAPEAAPRPPPSPKVESQADRLDYLAGTVSASRLNTFLTCRLKFYFRHVVKIERPKSPALHLGSTVHTVLKAWHKGRWKNEPLSPEHLRAVYETAWGSDQEGAVQWDDPEEEEAQRRMGWRLLEMYFRDSNIRKDVHPEAVEVPVETDLSRHGLPRLIGIIDLVQQGKIIDYKTAATTPNPSTAGHLHEVQVSSYAVLYRDATGRQETGIELHHLVKLKKNPKLVITAAPPITDRQQSRLFRLIESYVDGVERRDFIPSPGLACMSCEYLGQCRLWS